MNLIYKGKPLTFSRVLNSLRNRFYSYKRRVRLYIDYLKICFKVSRIRKQNKIKVVFVLTELAAWKTESLYLRMRNHPRFTVQIAIAESLEAPGSKPALRNYLEENGYEYVDLDETPGGLDSLNPDFLQYYKPYDGSYPVGHGPSYHRGIPCLFINYGFTLQTTRVGLDQPLHSIAWKLFDENNLVSKVRKQVAYNRGINTIVTGVPVQDDLMRPAENYKDQWKTPHTKKRIIYAPHHSLRGTNPGSVDFSTFLEFGEFMLEMARKYSKETTWVFKPHPTLYPKMLKVWPKEKLDAYYKAWDDLENGQYENGEYMGIFKYSDAMIHDCGSFVMEYVYVDKPVMFLMHRSPEEHLRGQNEFARKGFYAHYHGYNETDIENFIKDVIAGRDSMSMKRKAFIEECLIPPNHQSACDNIIDVILGQGPYKHIL